MIDKSEMIYYGKLLHRHNLVIGAGGNMSYRSGDRVLIKKSGADMSEGLPGDYVEVSLTGLDISNHPFLTSETPLHVGCYDCNEKIKAVVHTHSPYAIAAANKVDKFSDISYEFECLLGKSVPVIDYIEPGSEKLRDAVCKELKKGASALVLKKHGPVATGETLKEAFLRVLAIERAALALLNS